MSSASTGGTEGSSPASSPASAASLAMAAPKYGTLVPNRIFVGGISASTSEAELAQLFSTYGNVKATKIISDRAGVSKGYGFVTFETEEEAKRLQQESECIVLRERKLNIAPAIKKQPFNRSFDGGSGSPPAVPTSTYYYTNGMGLTYQNGMTFYNTGAPAPATPVAPPTDPATLYQATSVFGPQTTAAHQTFAPVMYPCPAPSLYVPQQYQYSAMPYEPYYAGAAAAGAPQYLYAAGNTQSSGNGGGSGSGGGANGTGATSPPAGPPPALASLPAPPQAHHFYASAAPPPHHHPQVPAGPPQSQVDHLYYSFTAGPPPHPPPHASMALADQQLLLYTTADPNCQPQQSNDGQSQQQESCLSDAGTEPGDAAAVAASAVAAQMHCRTIVYHPAATVYIPHSHTASPQFPPSPPIGGGSLLPTPTSPPSHAPPPHHHYHHHHHHSLQSNLVAPKLQTIVSQHHQHSQHHYQHQHQQQQQHQQRDFSKSTPNSGYNNVKSQNLSIALISSGVHKAAAAAAALQAHNKYAGVSDYQQKFTANVVSAARFTGHHNHQHHYAKQRSFSLNSSSCGGGTGHSVNYFSGQRSGYGGGGPHKSSSLSLGTGGPGYVNGYGYPSSAYKEQQSYDSVRIGRNVSSSREKNNNNNNSSNNNGSSGNRRRGSENNNNNNNSSSNNHSSTKNYNSQDSQNADSTVTVVKVTEKSSSPPPAPYSPMTRPLPILSPPVPQVQFYAAAQNRYQSSSSSSSQQQTQRRYAVAPALQSGGRKPSEKYSAGSSMTSQSGSSMLRQQQQQQQQQQQKYKPNGLMQVVGSGGIKSAEDSLGGAGDAPPGVGRLPITPPGTPRSGNHPIDQSQIGDQCSHQMQALSL